MKKVSLILICNLLAMFFLTLISSCSKEEVKGGVELPLSQNDVLVSIKKDMKNKKYYPEAPNKYDYSATNFNNFLFVNNASLKKTNDNETHSYESNKEKLRSYYLELGYSEEYLNDLFSKIENQSYVDSDEIINKVLTNEAEKNILREYIILLKNNSIDSNDFANITSIFEESVSKSDFSTKEKRDLLTIFNVGAYLKNKGLFKGLKAKNEFAKGPDLETVCAGNMIAGLVLGGITGNGLGAAVGLLGGAWQNYKAGCFDNFSIFAMEVELIEGPVMDPSDIDREEIDDIVIPVRN